MEELSLLCDSNLCRLCAESNENGIDIFTVDENSRNLQQLINKYLPIAIEKDNKFPKNICPGCHIQLESTKLFMDLIINGQTRLREIYHKQVANSKIVEFNKAYLNGLSNSTLYLANHKLKLQVEGLDKPKRKRGRPAKQFIKEEKPVELEENEKDILNVEEEELGTDGRKKRHIRIPARFDCVVQGKELEDILKKEGVLDDERTNHTSNNEKLNKFEIIIGRIEENGQDLDEPVLLNRKRRFKPKSAYFRKESKESETNCSQQESKVSINLFKNVNNVILNKTTCQIEENQEFITDPQIATINCSKCSRTFLSQESLAIHMVNHNKPRKFPCEICGKVLQHPSSLCYHKETEHANKRFVCNTCNRIFKHRQLLQRHQIVHSEQRPFSCSTCKVTFKTQANLINHQAVHTGEKRFECEECHQKFAHKTSLSLHQRWHEGKKPYTCDYCNKSFSQNGNLLEHKRIHTGEKPFFCEVCARFFTTSSQLRIHSKRHTGEKPWECGICGKAFLHKDTYKIHIRRHLNDRRYVCPICKKAFTERWALKKHQRIHTGEKPYKCENCLRAFADKSNLQKHKKFKKCTRNDFKIELEENIKTETNSLQLTQLIDQLGNPISLTTADGQTIPIVTSGDDDSNIQGLMPDGSLVPIEISGGQERDISEEISQVNTLDLLEKASLEESLGIDTNQDLSPNFQLLTSNDMEEVCFVTYSIEEDGALTQELVLESTLVQN